MSERDLRIGEFCLSNETNDSTVALYVREERKIVDGRALIFNASGPHNLMMEIHYIQLENGNKWVIGGRAFNGPMWIFSQLNKRLKISVNNKEQGFAMDLTIPTPSKKNPDRYTTSMTTIRELSGIYPNIFNLLQENGVDEIDLRSNLLNDTSSRKKFYTCLMKNPDCLAPVLIYFLTRIVALTKEYEKLLDEGKINPEQASHYDEFRFKGSETGADDLSRVDSLVRNMENGDFEDESVHLEYKTTFCLPSERHGNKVKDTVDIVLIEVASMLNTDGGLTVIGVTDPQDSDSKDWKVRGIAREIKEKGGMDSFKQFVSGSLCSRFGTGMVSSNISYHIQIINNLPVLIFDVEPSMTAIAKFKPSGNKVKNRLNQMNETQGIWVRVEDSSRLVAGNSILEWFSNRFTND